ncbi:uncharacterized protein LOC122258920 [Penaeus japonicus]|uniref:uncharacterized protein LOC122258920 n=1 Tax=Penaeus japonicus TaxID=27405 RepID=UPI001C715B48|nr:uncharacterized protein LOC122258920 [Penaeus japonicus]
MRFRFNPKTGRLGAVFGVSTPATMAPPRSPPEAPTIHFPTGTTFCRVVPGGAKPYAPVPLELAAKFQHFQLPNNLPVHVRGGGTDRFLYAVTGLVCAIGLAECFRVYYVLSYPQPAEAEE